MPPYRVDLDNVARRAIDRLPGNMRQRVKRDIDALGDNPYPPKSKKLRDYTDLYRLSLGDWGIIYQVFFKYLLVYVLNVKRKTGPETYENLNVE